MWMLSDPFPARVADAIVRTSIADGGVRIGVAVSGGADSVVLLSVLVELRERFGYTLTVLHVHHGLRGTESDLDEKFVRELAGEYQLPVLVEQGSVSGGENIEQAARNARRAFFARLMTAQSIESVALAHTLSDQAETVLLRLFRGTGLSGLAGMRAETDERLIRPLLGFTREEVRDYAAEKGLRWREDSSNDNLQFRRNLLRREIMPRLREAFHPHVERVLANTAVLAQAEEEYWEQEARRLFDTFSEESLAHGLLMDAVALRQMPLAAARRVMRFAIGQVKGNLRTIDSAHMDAILALCTKREGHSRVQAPGLDALRSFDRLRLRATGAGLTTGVAVREKRHYTVPIQWGQCATLPFHVGELSVTRGSFGEATDPADHMELVLLNEEFLKVTEKQGFDGMMVRNWEPGDSYVPVGHSNPVKIKELFQERRVYLWERSHWPVLEGDGRILWSPVFGPAADLSARTHEGAVAHLTYYRKQGESRRVREDIHRT
jgi:tRNA(Ile)-lysidine synthase